MPSIPLYPPSTASSLELQLNAHNTLPPLLQTPSGLAILELQGTINVPASPTTDTMENPESGISEGRIIETELGKIMFPDYSALDPDSTKWMKRVYLYAGRYQRMTGEVKKLPKPLAVIQRRQRPTGAAVQDKKNSAKNGAGAGDAEADELEIVEIIKYKIIFATRPEPVGME